MSQAASLVVALVCACLCCVLIASSGMATFHSCTGGSMDPDDYDQEKCFKAESFAPGVSAQFARVTGTRKDFLNIAEMLVIDNTGKNVAIGSSVTSSSQYGGIPLKNLTSGYGTRNFAHTKADSEAEYLEIDLGEEKQVSKVIVLNRGDCCKERIKGSFLTLYSKDKEERARSKEIDVQDEAYIWNCAKEDVATLKYDQVDEALLASNLKARYLKIMHTKPAVVINLASLVVFNKKDMSINLAEGRTVTANSVHPAGPLKNLVDGAETNFAHTHGPSNTNDWMLVDLGEEKEISGIMIRNRVDCCQDRAIGIQVEALDADKNVILRTPKIAKNHKRYVFEFLSGDYEWREADDDWKSNVDE